MSSACKLAPLPMLLAVAAVGWGSPVLRVCADPNNMAYSNEGQQGFENSLPPVQAQIRRGIVRNLAGYRIFGNLTEANPSSDLIRAIVNRQVDVATVWGPLADYFAQRSPVPLDLTPIRDAPTNPELPMSFRKAMGVGPQDRQLRRELDAGYVRCEPEIHPYGIPQTGTAAALHGGN